MNIAVRVTRQQLLLLDRLQQVGLHGVSRSQVARTLMMVGIEKAFADGLIHPDAMGK